MSHTYYVHIGIELLLFRIRLPLYFLQLNQLVWMVKIMNYILIVKYRNCNVLFSLDLSFVRQKLNFTFAKFKYGLRRETPLEIIFKDSICTF